MKKQGHITGFYLETLMLIVVFIAIILVLTQVFGLAKLQSLRAEQLTEAVTLAGNAAEAVSMSSSAEELLERLNEKGNATLTMAAVSADHDRTGESEWVSGTEEEEADAEGAIATGDVLVTARYGKALVPDPEGDYLVEITWSPEQTDTGTMIRSGIEVHWGADGETIYRLETESFRPEVAA